MKRFIRIGIFLGVMIVVGYLIGKDMAHRDNSTELATKRQT